MTDISSLSDEELNRLLGRPEQAGGDISQLSDTKLRSLLGGQQPGAYTGLSDAFKESVATTIGLPGTVMVEATNYGMRQLGLPEFKEPYLSGAGMKKLMSDIGITSGLTFEERSEAGKIGARAGEVLGFSAPMTAGMGLAARGVNLAKTLMPGYNPTMIK